MTQIIAGPALKALSCGKPAFLVVLLHGEGGCGQTMIDLAVNWAPAMPKAEFLAAEAPLAGRQWRDRSEGLAPAAAALNLFIDEQLAERRLPDSHLALVGFSQGANLALHVGLRRHDSIAAIVALSAAAYDSNALPAQLQTRPAILLAHGEADCVAPFASMLDAKAALKAAEIPVWSLKRPGLGHELDDDGVEAAGRFLAQHVVHRTAEPHDHDH
jgi:phospholipase/carboxylesterase